MSEIHGGLSCEAAEEDRYGLAHGYAELAEQRELIAGLVSSVEAAIWLMDRVIGWNEPYEPITKFAARRHRDEFRAALARARGES